jgi:hypothetical protein
VASAILNRAFVPVLQQLHQRLEHQLEDTKAQVTELREKLTQLWDRLHEEYRHRDKFLATHRGYSAATLKAVCITPVLQYSKTFTYQIECIIYRDRNADVS